MNHLCWSLFLIKLQAFRPTTLLKKRHQHRCFPVNIANILRAPILKNIYERLLLVIGKYQLSSIIILHSYLFFYFFTYIMFNLRYSYNQPHSEGPLAKGAVFSVKPLLTHRKVSRLHLDLFVSLGTKKC